MESNPYAPPQVDILHTAPVSDAETVRRENLKAEASIKSIGILYYLGAIVLFGIGVATVVMGDVQSEYPYWVRYVFIAIGLVQGWAGYGLRRLRAWARLPTIILSAIGLMGFPIGTLINAYIIYTVTNKKSRLIFSEEYQQIIAATPHVKYRSPTIVRVLLVVILVILALMIGSLILSKVA